MFNDFEWNATDTFTTEETVPGAQQVARFHVGSLVESAAVGDINCLLHAGPGGSRLIFIGLGWRKWVILKDGKATSKAINVARFLIGPGYLCRLCYDPERQGLVLSLPVDRDCGPWVGVWVNDGENKTVSLADWEGVSDDTG